MGKYQRRKGLNFERKIAISLRTLDSEAKRHLEYQSDEAGGIDIETKLPIALQCKCSPQISLALRGYFEAKDDAKPGQIPVCAWRSDRKGTFALIAWEDFLEMLALYHKGI